MGENLLLEAFGGRILKLRPVLPLGLLEAMNKNCEFGIYGIFEIDEAYCTGEEIPLGLCKRLVHRDMVRSCSLTRSWRSQRPAGSIT